MPVRLGASLARQLRMITIEEWQLWGAYVSLGGVHGRDEMVEYLEGRSEWATQQHNYLALALNEEFMEMGLPTPVPYVDDLVLETWHCAPEIGPQLKIPRQRRT